MCVLPKTVKMTLLQVWNKLDSMNEQLAIKRSLQLQSLFRKTSSNKDLLNVQPQVCSLAMGSGAVFFTRATSDRLPLEPVG